MRTFILIITLAGVILALLISLGCRDEFCPVCRTPADVDRMVATGEILLYDDAIMLDMLVTVTAGDTLPAVDSIKLNNHYAWFEAYSMFGSIVYLRVGVGQYDTTLSSGDIATLKIYNPVDCGVCEVDLLNFEHDLVTFPYYDTLDLNTSFDIVWSKVEGAEAYAYIIYHYFDSSGNRSELITGFQADTVFAIEAKENRYDGVWYVVISPVSVPEPTFYGGSFKYSKIVTGSVLCRGGWSTQYIYVGTGDPGPVGTARLISPSDEPEFDFHQLARELSGL
ncbi:MAG: hypothetical protein JSV52_08695 [Candidatus Zixiibacteriota bacterium]|nr:MAG: hypothetical protein JSV52_08695 [candidate division Zixibacteria bacterium]